MVRSVKRPGIIAILFLMFLFLCCSNHPSMTVPINPLVELRQELDQIFSDPDFSNAEWGVAIQSLANGQFLYLKNANKNFMPASNMKLLTTAAALAKLGSEYRYHTMLYTNGTINESGILMGDLILAGSGDPSFGSRYFFDKSTRVFEDFADSLTAKGITSVQGNIIGDDNIFDDEILGSGWSWDDGSDYYSAQIGGICFFDNCINVMFDASDTINARATFRLDPDTDYLKISKSEVKIVDPDFDEDIYFNRKLGTNLVTITGQLPRQKKEYQDWVTVDNPTLYAATIFKSTLIGKHISVLGRAMDIDDLENYSYKKQNPLVQYISPPLKDIVRVVNKVSQNLYAEQVLRTLGARFMTTGNITTGKTVLKEFLDKAGINSASMSIADGSGLSRYNLITPMQIITLLRYMDQQSYGTEFYESLPIAGDDGTLKYRMIGTKAEKNVYAKTGTLANVRCLSGYIFTGDGEKLAISMLVNNFLVPVSVSTRIQDLVCERLANFTRKL